MEQLAIAILVMSIMAWIITEKRYRTLKDLLLLSINVEKLENDRYKEFRKIRFKFLEISEKYTNDEFAKELKIIYKQLNTFKYGTIEYSNYSDDLSRSFSDLISELFEIIELPSYGEIESDDYEVIDIEKISELFYNLDCAILEFIRLHGPKSRKNISNFL